MWARAGTWSHILPEETNSYYSVRYSHTTLLMAEHGLSDRNGLGPRAFKRAPSALDQVFRASLTGGGTLDQCLRASVSPPAKLK